jgi:hypothetical protein
MGLLLYLSVACFETANQKERVLTKDCLRISLFQSLNLFYCLRPLELELRIGLDLADTFFDV